MLRGQKAEKMDALGCDERRGPGFASQSRRNFFTGAICQRCYSYARDWRAWAVLLSVLILLVAVMLYWCAKEYIHSVPTTLQPPQSFPFLSEEGGRCFEPNSVWSKWHNATVVKVTDYDCLWGVTPKLVVYLRNSEGKFLKGLWKPYLRRSDVTFNFLEVSTFHLSCKLGFYAVAPAFQLTLSPLSALRPVMSARTARYGFPYYQGIEANMIPFTFQLRKFHHYGLRATEASVGNLSGVFTAWVEGVKLRSRPTSLLQPLLQKLTGACGAACMAVENSSRLLDFLMRNWDRKYNHFYLPLVSVNATDTPDARSEDGVALVHMDNHAFKGSGLPFRAPKHCYFQKTVWDTLCDAENVKFFKHFDLLKAVEGEGGGKVPKYRRIVGMRFKMRVTRSCAFKKTCEDYYARETVIL